MATLVTLYRIIDTEACGQILANSIPTLTQAEQLLELLKRDYPDIDLAIESYNRTE
jgi:hypothetical protein